LKRDSQNLMEKLSYTEGENKRLRNEISGLTSQCEVIDKYKIRP